jgi:Spy/CpxP family protein refolding chaperone
MTERTNLVMAALVAAIHVLASCSSAGKAQQRPPARMQPVDARNKYGHDGDLMMKFLSLCKQGEPAD